MIRTIMFSLALSSFGLNAAPKEQRCLEIQNILNSKSSVDSLKDYLRLSIEKQTDLDDMFLCAKSSQTLPMAEQAGTLLKGDGWGSLRPSVKVPGWNRFQAGLGRTVWGGKVLQRQSNGKVFLLNIMNDRKGMLFRASVYEGRSIEDDGSAIILDYRDDNTDPVLSSLIRRVRDELRELEYRGEPSGIFLGRAFIYNGSEEYLSTRKWHEKDSYLYAANFLLDFRDKVQSDLPEWQQKHFDSKGVVLNSDNQLNRGLPLAYEDWDACAKQEYLWSKKLLPSELLTYPELENIDILGLVITSLTKKMNLASDISPRNWKKSIHAHGSVAKVSFEAIPNTPFTGIFEGADCGLIRMSVTGNPADRGFAPGAALKFFVDGQKSVNFSALYTLSGQGDNHNIMANELSNIVPEDKALGPKLINKVFSRVTKYPRALYLQELASVNQYGQKPSDVKFPFRLYLAPAKDFKFASEAHDFRSDLASLEQGEVLYNVFAVVPEFFTEVAAKEGIDLISSNNYRSEAVKIGVIRLESQFKVSSFGDSELFFRHQSYAND